MEGGVRSGGSEGWREGCVECTSSPGSGVSVEEEE